MQKGDRFLNCFTLELYTYSGIDKMGYIVLIKEDGSTRQIGKLYFNAKYISYSEVDYLKLKNNKIKNKRGISCEKDTDDLE